MTALWVCFYNIDQRIRPKRGEALRDRFIQTLIEQSMVIQNTRGQGYDGSALDGNGSKELVDLKKSKIHFILHVVYYYPDRYVLYFF